MIDTYLAIMTAYITYRLGNYLLPKLGTWVWLLLPRLKKNWDYNLHGDLCWWGHKDLDGYGGKVVSREILAFFFIKNYERS